MCLTLVAAYAAAAASVNSVDSIVAVVDETKLRSVDGTVVGVIDRVRLVNLKGNKKGEKVVAPEEAPVAGGADILPGVPTPTDDNMTVLPFPPLDSNDTLIPPPPRADENGTCVHKKAHPPTLADKHDFGRGFDDLRKTRVLCIGFLQLQLLAWWLGAVSCTARIIHVSPKRSNTFTHPRTTGTLPLPPKPEDDGSIMTILPVGDVAPPQPEGEILPGVPTPLDDNMTVLPLPPRDENGTVLLPPPPPIDDANMTDIPVGPNGELPPPPPRDENGTLLTPPGKSGSKSGKSGSKSGSKSGKSADEEPGFLPGVPTPDDVAPQIGINAHADAVQDQTVASRSPVLGVAMIAGVATVATVMVVLAAVGVRKLYKKQQGTLILIRLVNP